MTQIKKILVVDDDPDILKLMNAKLKASGYQVSFASDGVSCMSEVRKQDPDLIVLDLGLPAGDGFTTLERLKGQIAFSDIPVVVLTAREAAVARERAIEAGASAFFEKSESKDDVLAAIWRLLEDPLTTLA